MNRRSAVNSVKKAGYWIGEFFAIFWVYIALVVLWLVALGFYVLFTVAMHAFGDPWLSAFGILRIGSIGIVIGLPLYVVAVEVSIRRRYEKPTGR